MTIVVGERVVNWTMVGGGPAARQGRWQLLARAKFCAAAVAAKSRLR